MVNPLGVFAFKDGEILFHEGFGRDPGKVAMKLDNFLKGQTIPEVNSAVKSLVKKKSGK